MLPFKILQRTHDGKLRTYHETEGIKRRRCQNLRSLIAAGRSGSLMSLICCGRFMFLTAETARAGAAAKPAWEENYNILILVILLF